MTGGGGLSFRRGDLAAIVAVLLCALALGLALWARAAGSDRVVARVYQEGKLVGELPLDREASLTLTGAYTNTITVRDGRVAVVCLPNRVEIRLTGAPGVDAVVG